MKIFSEKANCDVYNSLFKCGHSGILPSRKGKNNLFAFWATSKKGIFYTWRCRKCAADYIKKKRITLEGWAKSLLAQAKFQAKKDGYKPPSICENDLIILRNKTTLCAACGLPLPDIIVGKNNLNPHLHHNHETGKVLGFTHRHCNVAEGMFSRIESVTGKVLFLKTLFPEVFS